MKKLALITTHCTPFYNIGFAEHRLVFNRRLEGSTVEQVQEAPSLNEDIEAWSAQLAEKALNRYLDENPEFATTVLSYEKGQAKNPTVEKILGIIKGQISAFVRSNIENYIGPDKDSALEGLFQSTVVSAATIITKMACRILKADLDYLTELPNKRACDERMDGEVERSRRSDAPFSIMIFDLDHFKQVNDTHGHPVGDEVLRETARRFKEAMRSADFVARYGGEEFVFILPDTDAKRACLAAERISEAINKKPYKVGGQEIQVSASIGVATFNKKRDRAAQSIIDQADYQLYILKGERPDGEGGKTDRRGQIAFNNRIVTEKELRAWHQEVEAVQKASEAATDQIASAPLPNS
ncbi:MAG: GGDEF domain-containing protein [Candidatus Peregrinibacteria bacterium]